MKSVCAKVSRSGRLVIPAEFCEALRLRHGGDVVIELDGRSLRIRMVNEVIDRAQAITQRLLAGNVHASVDAFLSERRREVT